MKSNKPIIYTAIGVVVVAALSFYSGMQTQKALATNGGSQTASAQSGGGSGGFGGGGGGQGGGGFRRGNAVFGTVQSLTSSSMTVSLQQGGTKTVSLTGNPTVTDGSGNQASVSSIQAGDTVVVFGTAGSDGSVTASRIRLNPSFGGGGGGGGSGPSSSSQSSGI